MPTFKQIDERTARELLEFARYNKNLGQTVEVDGKAYTFDYKSVGRRRFFGIVKRSFSVYFKTGRSIVRISDHWASVEGHDRSQKLNCGAVSGQYWHLKNKAQTSFGFSGMESGAYPWVLYAGIAGTAAINKTCEHWR